MPATLEKHRHFLRFTAHGLDDEQGGRRTTVSELCLGGLIKHVAKGEEHWANRAAQFQHLIAETAQHAGHADILRESLDGARSMG
nr:DUF664 domain-containing protein [Actinomadura sp. NBRC 104412]